LLDRAFAARIDYPIVAGAAGDKQPVSDQPVQIFLSYAHNDDLPPPDDMSRKGFVSALYGELSYHFRVVGGATPKIWRDTRGIDAAQQFDGKIEQAINDSSLLMVVLSPNWMFSDYCRRELAAFTERWKSDVSGLRERIIVVLKRHVDDDARPEIMQRQTGFRFYTLDEGNEVETEREFFVRGRAVDDRYHIEAERLGTVLVRRARQLAHRGDRITGKDEPAPVPASARRPGKTVFLAKPAADMRPAYNRLVNEIQGLGFDIVPDVARDIPNDATAVAYLDAALAEADVSIHLLGDKMGFAPEEEAPILQLQLRRAAVRAQSTDAQRKTRFQRLIWAPKIVPSPANEATETRKPLDVVARFDTLLPVDAIEGDTISTFVEFVGQRLQRLATPPEVEEESGTNRRIYVYHRPEDVDYAVSVGKALKARDITPKFPAFEGTDAEKVQFHRQMLRACDSVLVCWAAAPDVWVKVTSNELVDWKTLGRTKGFFKRGLVAGPPPGKPKKTFVEFCPNEEIDVVLDLTGHDQPEPEHMSPILAAE